MIKQYIDYFDLINQFGIGMILFPSIVTHLKGSYGIEVKNQVEREDNEEIKGEE